MGRDNEDAHTVCYQFATSPIDTQNNSLYICGPSGFGKSHLASAVKNRINSTPNRKAIKANAGVIYAQYQKAILNGELSSFRQSLRSDYGVVIIDDAHLHLSDLAYRQAFNGALNSLIEKDVGVVLVSDRPPRTIEGLDKPLCSYFKNGRVAEIPMPDFEMRKAILRNKASACSQEISEEALSRLALAHDGSLTDLYSGLEKTLSRDLKYSHSALP